MEIHPKDYCIFIASHVSKHERIPFIKDCLLSLIEQKMPISIYVSISFKNEELKQTTLEMITQHEIINSCGFLNILVRKNQCSQMQHFQLLLEEINDRHKWIMFCDDDDTYHKERTYKISYLITLGVEQYNNHPFLNIAGLYECVNDKDHRQQRQEYWSYCVHKNVITTFYTQLQNYVDVLKHSCCDVLFAEYLRRKSKEWGFLRLTESCYHYRTDENPESITHFITSQQKKYTNKSIPPSKDDPSWKEYINGYNQFLHENMSAFEHDLYVLCIMGIEFDEFLKREFLANYSILDYVDSCHVERLRAKYDYWIPLFRSIYEIL
tara:strand:- start:6 stop:974 length:969 start_codon:yes stop_codon:yes gene_type:complete